MKYGSEIVKEVPIIDKYIPPKLKVFERDPKDKSNLFKQKLKKPHLFFKKISSKLIRNNEIKRIEQSLNDLKEQKEIKMKELEELERDKIRRINSKY